MAKGKRTGDVPDDEEVSGATVDNAADSGQVVDGGRGEEMKESSVLGENLDDPGDVDAAAAVDEDASKTRAEAEAATILTKHELSEKVRRSETKYDLMVCFCAYLRMWTETSVVKDFCRVVEADSKAFAAKAFDGVWAEVYGEKSYDDPLTVKEALAESRKIFFGESNPFDLQFPVVVTDENLPRLRRIAQLVGVGLSNGSQDLSGKSLRDKMGLIAELYKKEDGGEDLDQFLGKMNFGIFDRMYGMGGVSKKEIVEFCMALTEKGRANLAILEELQVIFYSTGQDVADINAVDTDFLRQFLALKGAGIDTGNLTPAQFLKAEEKISKENIDMFCEIYGGTGFKIYELEQITQLEDLKLTKNAVKAIHIFKKTGKDFSWQSNVSELNELTDVAVEALELFVDGFFEVYGSSEGKFKALNKLSREQLEFFKSLQKVNLPEAVLFTLIILSEEGKVLPGILTEEEIKVANFVLMEFISVRDLRVDEIVPLIRRIQNSGITLAELSAEIEKIDTPELREAAGKWALKPDSAGLKIVDMILFAYGGRESTLKLHGAGSLIKHAGNIDRIVGALGSRDGAIDALIRELNRPKNKGDFDLNNIVEVGQANCERSTKLVKLFPFCEFHNRIPEFAYKITDEEWQLLSGRAEKLGGLELVTDIGEIEKVIGIILKVDEKVFVEVPLFFAKMGAQLKGLLRAVDFAGECVNGGPKAAQVATLKRLDSYFPNCIVTDDVSQIADLPKVEEVDWEVIRECLEKAPGLAKLGDLSTIGWYLGRSILDKPSFAKIPFFFGRTSGNLPWRARMALSLCNSFTEEEKVASLKKLGEYFPDYEFVDGVTSFDVVAESAWVKLGNRLKTCPEFAKLKDLADIKLFMQMDDASFAELPFFFEKTKFKEGVSEKFKGARALIGRYAGKDADPNELAVLKRLDKHFTFYKFGDAFPSFGEIAEPRWERLEKRLKDHPNLAFAMDLECIKSILSMDDNSFENLAYLLDRGWGFGNVDERWKLVVELELLGEDREFLDDVVGAIEKSGTSLEFQLRVKALNLFEKNSGRMRVFEKLIVRPQNAAAFLENYELYGSNNKLLRIVAFLLRPGERLAISDFSEYVNDRKNLHTGDDVVGFSEKFVKEKFLGRRADWTKGDSLQEFWKLFPEFDFFKKVNEKNVLFLVFVYANIGADNNVSEEIKQLRVQVKDLLAANKDLALGVLNGVRDKVLVSEDKGMDDEKAMVGVLAEGNITNYKILERTTQYIKMICDMEQPESPNALVGMEERREIRSASSSLLVKFALKEKGSKRINYSNDDYASFYEKCMTVGQKELPDLLMSFDVLQVDKGNFAFMQREIMGAMAVINLLTAGKEGGFSEDLVDGLREVKLGLEKLKNTLGVDNDPAKQREILRKFHEGLQKFIKKIFSQTLGLQNLPELTQEMMDQVGPYLIYLSNIRDINDDKRGILSLFILLKLLGKWDEFKRGEDVKIDNYLTDSLKKRVHVYLKERKDLDIFDGKGERDPALSIDEENKLNWMKTLAGRSEAILIGESRGILDTMQQIEGNYKGLLDPDNFSETEKALSAVVGEFGAKAVAGSLARRFKNAEFTDEIIGKLPLGAGVDEKEMVPAMQKMAGIFGALPSFVKAVEEAKLAEKIQSLEVALKPSEQVIAIFKKIGEEMSTASGARPVSEDVEHLRSVLHKKREELTAEEFSQAENYIDAVKLEVLGANNLRDELTAKFMVLHEASKKIELGTVFQSRMEEFRKVFIVDESESKVTLKSTMTGDLADVIPHIRQCLGCTTREFNNDTNLTFGDRNRFYLVVREFGMPESKSISDELVTVQMTVEGVSEGEEKKIVYSFVMDTVYDHTTRDVLVCNVLAVLKKLKELHRLSPDTAIDVFVTDAALKSCGVGQDYLKEKLTAEFGVVNIERIIKEVHIAQSASGDGHYEIGGGLGGRVSNRKGQVGGLKVWI